MMQSIAFIVLVYVPDFGITGILSFQRKHQSLRIQPFAVWQEQFNPKNMHTL